MAGGQYVWQNTKGFAIPASRLGKVKMALQVATILLLIVGWGPLPMVAPVGRVMLWVVLVAAVVSAVDYYRRFQRLLSARVTDINLARARTGSSTKTLKAG